MNAIQIVELIIILITFIISIICFYYTYKTKRRYEKIALKLGNGKDITEILDSYIKKVDEISNRDDEIIEFCNKLQQESLKTIKKVGLVKYDAYLNTKNKLSFALALLNKDNTGIVLNSVYGFDDSNIFAKPVIKGESKYNLSSEEKDAIEKAKKS